MKLLAIDTSTDFLSLAVMDSNDVLARIHRSEPRSHSSLLVPMIDEVLKMSGVELKALDGFCLSIGPGSFTGLRIGVTTIKGLGVITKKPIVVVPTLDVIAQNAKRFHGIICTVLDARKAKAYACIYRSDGKGLKKLSKVLLAPVAGIVKILSCYDEVLFLGDFADKIAPQLSGARVMEGAWQPRPEVVGILGLEYFKKKRFVKAEDLEPSYIYSKECDVTGR